MTPTLDQVLALADEARRSPHARRVLHDALLERYHRYYLTLVRQAQSDARSLEEPVAFVFYPETLTLLEKKWRSGPPSAQGRNGLRGAFSIWTVRSLRSHRRFATTEHERAYRWFNALPDARNALVLFVVGPRSPRRA